MTRSIRILIICTVGFFGVLLAAFLSVNFILHLLSQRAYNGICLAPSLPQNRIGLGAREKREAQALFAELDQGQVPLFPEPIPNGMLEHFEINGDLAIMTVNEGGWLSYLGDHPLAQDAVEGAWMSIYLKGLGKSSGEGQCVILRIVSPRRRLITESSLEPGSL